MGWYCGLSERWAACGPSVRVPSGSPAVHAAKPQGIFHPPPRRYMRQSRWGLPSRKPPVWLLLHGSICGNQSLIFEPSPPAILVTTASSGGRGPIPAALSGASSLSYTTMVSVPRMRMLLPNAHVDLDAELIGALLHLKFWSSRKASRMPAVRS